jgi:methionyl-tRNA formyltransferase
MNIGVICNSKLSLPSIHSLLQLGHQVSMAMPNENGTAYFEMESFANQFGIQVSKFQKGSLDQELIYWKTINELDFMFVITFPYILSKKLISTLGIHVVNFHFAPLPQYKGAQPVFWMLKNGEKKGGVTAHIMTPEIDGGAIIHFEPYSLPDHETYSSYLTKMSYLNAKVIQKVLQKIGKFNFSKLLKPQNKLIAVYHKKPQLTDVRIDWQSMKAIEIERLCRACNSWNKGALTTLNNSAIKIIEVELLELTHNMEQAGQVIELKNSKKMAISSCDNKYLEITIAYEENLGFFGGERLFELGFTAGAVLH